MAAAPKPKTVTRYVIEWIDGRVRRRVGVRSGRDFVWPERDVYGSHGRVWYRDTYATAEEAYRVLLREIQKTTDRFERNCLREIERLRQDHEKYRRERRKRLARVLAAARKATSKEPEGRDG